MDSLGQKAEECLYVADTPNEVDGARSMGMTAFLIERKGKHKKSEWTITNLKEIITYLRENNYD